jgi:hypothetical protein
MFVVCGNDHLHSKYVTKSDKKALCKRSKSCEILNMFSVPATVAIV